MDKGIIMGTDICTFCFRPCYKSVEDDCDGKKEELSALLKLFGRLVERYLGGEFQFLENGEQAFLNVKICEDCNALIKGFCDLYHEWKCLEMRLEWKLRKLMDIMYAADKVRSRKQAFQASFNVCNVDADEENGLFRLTSRFRRNFKRQCKLHDANSFPKVLLHRKRHRMAFTKPDIDGNATVTPNVGVDDVSKEVKLHFQLGWISTFAALLLLSYGFEKPRKLVIDEEMNELLKKVGDSFPFSSEISPKPSPQPNFGSSEVEVERQDAAEDPDEPLSEIGGSEEQEIAGIKAKLQQPDRNPKRSSKRRTQIQKPFACHCCNSRKFTSYQSLLKHRRAFTHFLMRMQLQNAKATKKKSRMRATNKVDNSPILSNQTEASSSLEIISNLENIGVLRPLRSRRKRSLSEVKTECESDDSIPATSTDNDDDQEWNTSSSDETSSSSNSSDCEYTLDDDISCSFCSKVCRASTLVRHQKKCLSNPANVQLMTKRKRRRVSLQKLTCDIGSCTESFNLKEELEIHKKLHGSFPCAFCDEVEDYGPDLALHEREHAKNIKSENKSSRRWGQLPVYCARCSFSTFRGRAVYISHFLKVHLNQPQRFLCPICKVSVGEKRHLKPHITRVHGENNNPESVFNCTQCPAYFLQKYQLNIHQKTHPSVKQERTCVCDVITCKKAFVTEMELEAHKRLHGNFPCKFCSTVESYAPNLAVHELVHRAPGSDKNSASGQYGCARCNFHTNSKRKYTRHHAIRHLQLRLGTELCAICQVTLSGEEGKKRHFLRHHNTSEVDPKSVKRCKECPAYFLKTKQLHLHKIQMHNQRSSDESSGSESEPLKTNTESEKPVVCKESHCRQRFECQELLDLHKKMHGSFQCQFCSVVKHYAPKLAIHELAHSIKTDRNEKNKVYNCARCKYPTKIKQYYVDHFLKCHLDLPAQRVMCQLCKILLTKKSFKAHYKAFHDINNVDPSSIQKCDKCSTHFLKRSQLDKHVKNLHLSTDTHRPVQFTSRNLKYCERDGCNKAFELTEDLERHQKLHGKFICSFCPVETSYAPKLAMHEITHLPSSSRKSKGSAKFFNCSRCTSMQYGKFQFETHFLETHLKLPSEGFTCQICREKFSEKRRLREHAQNLHNTEGMRVEDISRCNQCPAYFQKRIPLLNHKKKMHGEDPLKCVDCGKVCKDPCILRAHRKNKHGKKESEFTFVCDDPNCERRFETSTELEWHKHLIHSSKGNYNSVVCHVCGELFAGKGALAIHIMRRHPVNPSNEKKEPKRYVCEECGKFFKAQAILEVHKLSHSGPASWKFSCLFCEKKCHSEESLFGHLRTHTNEKVFICEYCGEEYAHGHNLRNHKNKQHDANDLPKVQKYINARVSRKGQKLPPRSRK